MNRVISAVCKHGITPALSTRPASRLRGGLFLKPGSPAANVRAESWLNRNGRASPPRALYFAMALRHMGAMLRRAALLALAALAAAPLAAAQQPGADLRPRTSPTAAPVIVALDGAARTAAIARANTTLNGIERLQGRFVQSAPDGGRAGGAFYLQRPGKLRFEYDPPATLLIVSDGSVVAMRDTELRTTERTPLRSTPLNLILGQTINLERDARITRVAQSGQWTMITARDRSGQTDGQITLHFYGPSAELRSWDVIDATGARTRITLSELTQPASLDRRLFRLEDMLSNNRGRPGR